MNENERRQLHRLVRILKGAHNFLTEARETAETATDECDWEDLAQDIKDVQINVGFAVDLVKNTLAEVKGGHK